MIAHKMPTLPQISNLTAIQDPDDPRLAAYRSLKGKSLEREGIFMAEGEKVVRSMVESGCRIASCLVSGGTIKRYKGLLAKIAGRKASVFIADNRLIEGIIGFRFHKGIMAVGYCPKKLTVSDVLKTPSSGSFFVALNAINDPQNVGLIARNAAAFGARALIVDNVTYDPYYRKSVRVSMGTIFRLPVCYEDDLGSALVRLKKKHDTRIIVATPGRGAGDISKVKLSGNICFVFGNEDKGISRKILNIADAKVRIPISKAVDSLNVASASAVCLYEASRCRRQG
ncbi:MAG: RNA methyltransferase [Candidatus Omnitrophica bacterium]|nr:RNA methyltransferase [Candidatus Omnitrophota bacterium]